jgi:hypothetical protein
MKAKTRLTLLGTAVAVALTFRTTVLAQQASTTNDMSAGAKSPDAMQNATAADEDAWHFAVVPLGWMAGINGNVTVRGHQVNTEVNFDQILDHLKGIAMVDFEVSKSKFGFYAQPNWIKLEADGGSGLLNTKDTMNIWIVDAAFFYQFAKWGKETPVTLDALAGVRYWNIGNDLNLSGPLSLATFGGSSTLSLIDPIIGLRSQIYLTKKLSLRLHGDIGGFGISYDSSDFSWQALAMLDYDFTRNFSLLVGYRALSVDKHTGGGPNEKGAHLILSGAILGLDFHW